MAFVVPKQGFLNVLGAHVVVIMQSNNNRSALLQNNSKKFLLSWYLFANCLVAYYCDII